MDVPIIQLNWLEFCKSNLLIASRFCLVIVNNVYCLPIYIIWMLILYPLRKLQPQFYWRLEGRCFHWLLAMVAMWSWSAGYHIVEMGHKIEQCINDRTLVLVNHQSTGDVPLLMALFNTKPNILPNINWIMDYFFKFSNFGIVSAIHGDFFIVAGKNNREKTLKDLHTHLIDNYLPRNRKFIVLFPEGGFLSNRKEVSQRYALKNNLPNLENVTIPRFGAFQTIVDTLDEYHELQWILDVTIAYPKDEPIDLTQILLGTHLPCRILMYFRLYSVSEIAKDNKHLENWLLNRFEEKDRMLSEFYETGRISINYCTTVSPDLEVINEPVPVNQDPFRFFLLHVFCIVFTYINFKVFRNAFQVFF